MPSRRSSVVRSKGTDGGREPPPSSIRLALTDGTLRLGDAVVLEGASPHVHASRAWRHERLPRAVPSRSGGPGGAVEVAIVGFDVSEDEDGGRTKRMRMGGSEGARSPDDGSGRRSGKRSRHVVTLASSMPAVTRFVSCARCKLWWMTPAWGVATDQIPAETQFLVLELDAGKAGYVVLVPMISPEGFRVTLSGHANEGGGRLCMVAESNCDAVVTDAVEGALAIAASSSPFEAVEAAVAAAAAHMGTFGLRVDKSPPPIVDVFGWCTWDAFYHQVTPDGIESGVASLADGGTPARFVIVDDGWQSVLPDAVFKKKVDHISGVPAAPPQSRLAEEEASGGWMTRAGSSVASGLESMYWHGLHSTPYGSYSWHALRILGQYCLSPAIRAAVSTLSCFNHRVSRIEANVKFQFASGGRTSKDKRRGTASGGDGLRHVVSRIKQLGVHHVYCWHALFGYWGGLHPAEPGVAKYNPKLKTPAHSPGVLTVEPSQAWDPITLGGVGVVAPEKLGQFYEELHSYLAASGVDGIKVDGQAMVGGLGQGEGGGPALAKRLHGALEASAARHFPTNGLINCMCHSNENILNFSGSALARVSDDFYPNNDASHTVHIANVAYNSVFMVVWPDWDMFHSKNEAGELHAAARAVGGCPVYVSDTPGCHDFDVLRQLVFPSGKVLRASLPGRPTRDCLFVDVTTDGASALKVWNKNGRGGVVGCFNIQGSSWSRKKGIFVNHAKRPPAVKATVRVEDVEGIVDDYPESGLDGSDGGRSTFAVQAHRTHGLTVLGLDDTISISLEHKEYEIYTIAPIMRVGDVSWAPVALNQMFNGGGAVIDAGLAASDDGGEQKVKGGAKGLTGTASVYGIGAVVCYANSRPTEVAVDGDTGVKYDWNEVDGCLVVSLGVTEGVHELRVDF